MMHIPTIRIALLGLAAVACSAFGAEKDLTDSLERLGVPGAVRWPGEPKFCAVKDLQVYKDRVYVGFGDYGENVGPCPIVGMDTYDGSFHTEFVAGTECIEVFRVFSDGRLYMPSIDHMDKGNNPNGFWFRRELDGQWTSNYGIPGGATKMLSIHCWNLGEFENRIFYAGYGIAASEDFGKTWKDVAPDAKNGREYFHLFNEGGTNVWYRQRLFTENRYMGFLRLGTDFFCMAINRCYRNGFYEPFEGRDIEECNPPVVWRWNRETEEFKAESVTWNDLMPELKPEDLGLYREDFPNVAKKVPWLQIPLRTVQFGDRGFFITSCGDYIPVAASCLRLEDGKLRADRMHFPPRTFPADVTVCGNAAYFLTITPEDGSTRHGVWKTTDGVNCEKLFDVRFRQAFTSLEYHQGYFYFGATSAKAIPSVKGPKNAKDDAGGEVHRLWCPQEPVQVVVPQSLKIKEGGEAEFTVALSAAPTSDIRVAIEARDCEALRFEPAEITFTPADWNTPRTIRATYPNNDVGDPAQVSVVCGVRTEDSLRGRFASAEVTPAICRVELDGNDLAPTVDSAVWNLDFAPASYTVTLRDFGMLNGIPARNAELRLSAQSLADTSAVFTATATVDTLGTPQTVELHGLVPGVRYAFTASVCGAETPARVDTAKHLAPLAGKASLTDLTDDPALRAGVYGVSNVGPKDASGAWDNDLQSYHGGFGGYASPHAIYAFTEPQVVNGLGVMNMPNGSRDRAPGGFALYGGADTNNWIELGVWKNEPAWANEGEWRRYPVANTNAYPFYKFNFRGSIGANSAWVTAQELELYAIPETPCAK